MNMMILLKAVIPGGAHSDLFGTSVEVHGHTRAGKYVAPYTSTRQKAAPKPPPPERVKAEWEDRHMNDALGHVASIHHEGVHYKALLKRQGKGHRWHLQTAGERTGPIGGILHQNSNRHTLGGAVSYLRSLVKHGKITVHPDGPPAAAAPAAAGTAAAGPEANLSAHVELASLRRRIDAGYAELAKRYGSIRVGAVERAKALEPGRGSYFGRGATTWTKRQEGWFQDALRDLGHQERDSAKALGGRLVRLMDVEGRMAAKLGVNAPWRPNQSSWADASHLLDLLDGVPAQDHEGWRPKVGEATPGPAAPEPPHIADMKAKLLRLQGNAHRRTASEEKLAKLYLERLSANPDKWKPGMGVRWGVHAGGRMEQWNRGFRVVEVSGPDRMALIRSVRDTGLTTTGGNNDRIGDEWVYLGDLRRVKADDRGLPA